MDYRKRIELLQDFDFPTASQKVRVSPDAQYVIVAGTYPPQIKGEVFFVVFYVHFNVFGVGRIFGVALAQDPPRNPEYGQQVSPQATKMLRGLLRRRRFCFGGSLFSLLFFGQFSLQDKPF